MSNGFCQTAIEQDSKFDMCLTGIDQYAIEMVDQVSNLYLTKVFALQSVCWDMLTAHDTTAQTTHASTSLSGRIRTRFEQWFDT